MGLDTSGLPMKLLYEATESLKRIDYRERVLKPPKSFHVS